MLVSSIHSIVVNPPWNVPASIAKRELWPKGRAALIRQGYKIVGTPETGERIVQPAGPRSEEHTSELQSLMRISYDVFCLKKKNTTSSSLTMTPELRYHRPAWTTKASN